MKKIVKPAASLQPSLGLEDGPPPPPAPDFRKLLRKPLVQDPLPSDFVLDEEASHLERLWQDITALHRYEFLQFVHAGGSGMVFQVGNIETGITVALKLARKKLIDRDKLPEGAADSLSPVSDRELRALEKLSHPSVVHLFDVIGKDKWVIAVATTYVERPHPLDSYLRTTLEKRPSGGEEAFSAGRLDRACGFLLERSLEIAEALAHMHGAGIYHLDIKPANILIGQSKKAVLTDLGACVHRDDLEGQDKLRVHFTWTYAHPDLTSMIRKPQSITGGGLKVSVEVKSQSELQKYDLFAFGRTLQESLGILWTEFGERAYASYGFRYLHVISSLLLDGHNAPEAAAHGRIPERDGKRFVSDVAMSYPAALFSLHRIQTADELVERLRRFRREYSWAGKVPELDPWLPNFINTGIGSPAPFTDRVAELLGHPVARRLKTEAQLGWIREIFPGATHNRWSHSIGVYSNVVGYYAALLSDPDVPTMRILLDPGDIAHAMVGALLHDIGQVGFGHDLEAACPALFNHDTIFVDLLHERAWGEETLEKTLKKTWKEIDTARLSAILEKKDTGRPIDGVAQDILNGPIDADKLDYVRRDSAGCGVPYGMAIDPLRFMQALSVSAKDAYGNCRLALAVKAKGQPAIESVLLARYQMYNAIYWHHTFRCVQAMFSHATAMTFGALETNDRTKLRHYLVTKEQIKKLLYHWVVCRKTNAATQAAIKALAGCFSEETPQELNGERALELVWKFSSDGVRKLVERLARRDLYKRIIEIRVEDLGDLGDYSAMASALAPSKRPGLATKLEDFLFDSIQKAMNERGPRESTSETDARERLTELRKKELPRLVIDFPVRGLPEERNFPPEIGDSERKYTINRGASDGKAGIFHHVRKLQANKATVRVFAAKELHELVVRYLSRGAIEACLAETIPMLRRGR